MSHQLDDYVKAYNAWTRQVKVPEPPRPYQHYCSRCHYFYYDSKPGTRPCSGSGHVDPEGCFCLKHDCHYSRDFIRCPRCHLEDEPIAANLNRKPSTSSTAQKEERVSELTTLFAGYENHDPESGNLSGCIFSHRDLAGLAATVASVGLPVPDWVPAKLDALKAAALAKVLAEKKQLLAAKKAKLAEMISREEKRKALRDEIAALEAELGGAPRE